MVYKWRDGMGWISPEGVRYRAPYGSSQTSNDGGFTKTNRGLSPPAFFTFCHIWCLKQGKDIGEDDFVDDFNR